MLTSSSSNNLSIDGAALIRARAKSKQAFERVVEFYRARGATDSEMLRAMTESRAIISPLRLRR